MRKRGDGSGGRGVRLALPQEGLAYRLRQAGSLIEAVLSGKNLTDAFSRLQQDNPGWSDATRGAVHDLAWGTLRNYGRGDRVLHALLHKPLPEEVRALLLATLYRLNQRPEQAFSIVDQAVEAVASFAPGLRGVVNAVLRNSLRQSARLAGMIEADEPAQYCHPAWWIARLRTAYPRDWKKILDADNSHPPMTLRINRRRSTSERVIADLQAAGIPCQVLDNQAVLLEQPVPVSRIPGFAEGNVSVQDAGAQRAATWLDSADGMRVLDACSAPGGKAAHVLELADVALTALEMDRSRSLRITENLERLGLAATVCTADARRPADWWDGQPFDRILADVPCSASGVVRRHPDIKWLRRDRDIAAFARQQAQIIDALWQTLAAGGKMLYVTCSVFPQENRLQVEEFCVRHEDARRLPLQGELEQQLLPDAEHDGFYYALLGKQ